MDNNRFSYFETESEILKAVASNYPAGSREYLAIKMATFAMLFATTEQFEGFKLFVRNYEGELTRDQRKKLAELGLDVD